MPLTIESVPSYGVFSEYKISGFTSEEINAFRKMEYHDLEDAVVRRLDTEHSNIGTCWKCGYGIYDIWIPINGCVYVKVGNSCD